MKTFKMNLFLVLLFMGITIIAKGQSANEWRILLNNDHSAFTLKLVNNEFTFFFSPQKDTLSFSHGNKKPIKPSIVVEVSLKNNSKVIYTTSDKNLNSDKTVITLLMSDVYAALKNIKLPSKPKYVISIKEKTTVREKLLFEFTEK
jgi:hypothetical protein